MPYVVGKNATLRQGQFIPGGQAFEVSLAELPELQEAGFRVTEAEDTLRPNIGRINNTPEKEPGVIPQIYPGEIPDSGELLQAVGVKRLSGSVTGGSTPMGNATGKAKSSSKVRSKKEV